MGRICRIILPVCSYLLHPPSSSLSLTFLHSSPADLAVLSALSFSPPHTRSCPPPIPNPPLPLLLLPSLLLGSPLSPPLAASLFCSLQLYILCFLIRHTRWLHLPPASYTPPPPSPWLKKIQWLAWRHCEEVKMERCTEEEGRGSRSATERTEGSI